MALTYNTPPANEVYAMDSNGMGHIEIKFTETTTGTASVVLKNTETNAVIPVTLTKNGNNYTANLTLPKGLYEYYFVDSLVTNNTPTKYNLGVGYVFVIVGHSLASSNGEQHATDSRVRIYNNYQAHVDADWKTLAKYSGGTYRKATDIYAAAAAVAGNVSNLYDGFQVGPWSKMADLIATRDNCPVAIINTAMGGSSVKMWADEAAQRPFVHGFAASIAGVEDYNLYNSGIPYFHFENVLKTFGKRTGVSAVLVQHGENDDASDSVKMNELIGNYKTIIDTARNNSGLFRMPFVIAKSAWLTESAISIQNKLQAIDSVTATNDFTHFGIDTHTLPQTLRGQPNNAGDGHWNPAGSQEVGRMWAERLTANFLLTINNGVSTLKVKPPEGEPITEPPEEVVETGNSNTTTMAILAKLNWTAAAIIAAVVGGIFFGLRYFKVFKKITNAIIFIGSLIVGFTYLTINYFVNQKRQV
ncbi:hypothetical protein LV89_01850 [Arcicella aurantiaca]|uniref:Sialate O-acetylesterase domain-containing protein n=1 Tax=Arcicella aurantiaca TaxID=591202 RepID=A0A316EBT3_9BACT|nr:sialate O-acetylesterase [Arcicella aurantiaca]PWK27038.1 hypothetical protein LV89_01850 [Arcicella aurantiaca]